MPGRSAATSRSVVSGAVRTCELLGAPIAAAFPVTEVTLVQSTLGRRGSVYDIVDRLPTAARGAD